VENVRQIICHPPVLRISVETKKTNAIVYTQMACREVRPVQRLQRRRAESTQTGHSTSAVTPLGWPLHRQVTATTSSPAGRVRRQTTLAWLGPSTEWPGRLRSIVGLLHGQSV